MSGFELIPAIDLLDGRCVRLAQGDYERATVYGDDPAAVAEGFVEAGAPRVHVVDLDGARSGQPVNGPAVEQIVARAGGVPVQLGGGLRSLESVERALVTGVDRVILGTAALRDAGFVRDAAALFPGRIVLGLDARDGRVAVEGWLETSEVSALELACRFADAGIAAIVYTDVSRDGVLAGPNLEATAALAEGSGLPVIASGGVRSAKDVLRAAELAERGVVGAIVGRALYTGDLDLAQTLRSLACS